MEKKFVPVTDKKAFEQLLGQSNNEPVLLFKHSTTCPISAGAYKEMSQLKSEVNLVIVQRARDVSHEVEERTGVRHESPQAILLRNGQVAWSASHYDITAKAVEQAISENS